MRVLPISIQQAKEQDSVFFIELYKLSLRNGVLYLAACDEDIIYKGQKYAAMPIERGTYRSSVDPKIDNIELKIGNVDSGFTLALFQGFDFRGCNVEVIKMLYDDEPDDREGYVIFTGYIDDPHLSATEFRLSIKSRMPEINIPRRWFGITCSGEFGDSETCGAFKLVNVGAVGEGSTTTKVLDFKRTETEGFWTDGIIRIAYESRKIINYAPGVIEIDYPFLVEPKGDYKIEQGCNKTFEACKKKNNGHNFSGFPSIPFEQSIRT